MGTEDQSTRHDSGIINMEELVRASRTEEGFEVVLRDVEDAAFAADFVIYETRAKIRNSQRGLTESWIFLTVLSGQKLSVPRVNAKEIFIEDRIERVRDAKSGNMTGVRRDMHTLSRDQLSGHERIRYLRDKFKAFLRHKRYEEAAAFAEKEIRDIKDAGQRENFCRLIGYEIEERMVFYINNKRLGDFTEIFFALSWEQFLGSASFAGVKREVIESNNFKSTIRKALICVMDEESIEASHTYRGLLKKCGLYLS